MYIDLTVLLSEETPVYPGDPKTVIKPAGILAKDGFSDHYLCVGTHVGTHIDAPMHMLADGMSLDKFTVDCFIGEGKYIEVVDGSFDVVKAAGIMPGDIVLFRTGMSNKYYEPAYFEDYPAMSEETAQFLVEASVKMVGVDACSVDNQAGFPVHKILLAGGVLIIENLTNLRQLKNKNFTIYALPMSLTIEAAPARVIAVLDL